MAEIVVFGATGYTGTLIARALHERGLPFAIAGRSRAKLEQLSERVGNAPLIVAEVGQPHTLNTLLAGTRVLINTVGPFLRWGEPVLNAAVEKGVHYLDTTGEQTWMKRMLNRYDGVALRNDVTVVNAMAFEYAVGDWLAALAAEKLGRGQRLDSISVGYSLANMAASTGTALSIVEMLGEQGWSYEGGHWQRRPVGWTSRRMPFPFGEREVTWLPFGETLLVPRHESVQTVLTYSRVPRVARRVLSLAAPAGAAMRAVLRPVAARALARRADGPSEAARLRSRFALVAEARRAGSVAHATATGSDPYGLTARIAALGAEILLNEAVPRGVRAPAHLPIDPSEALARLGVGLSR